MLNTLRRITPAGLKRPLKRMLGMPMTRLHPDWSILAPIGPVETPHVVIDAGAHAGWFFHCWQDWCPGASIHAFEPYPPSFEDMKAEYGSDPGVTLVQAALGAAEGEASLQVLTESLVSNSLLAPERSTWDEIRYRTGEVRQVTVPVLTLDGYCARNSVAGVYLLKIDVQGYELQVLRGAEGVLARTDHVFVESAIRPLYENAATFTEVVEFMRSRRFHLMAMRSWHRGNHLLIETDMLFRRDGLEPPVDESIVRTYENG